MKTRLLVLLVVVLGLAGPTTGQNRCTFPGASTCADPAGLWIIEWREPPADGKHSLLLKPTSGGSQRILLQFARSVDLMWSTDGRALAVTDHAGSNESDLRVFAGSALSRVVDVQDRLRATLGTVPEIFNNGHRYFEALDWVAPDVLRFRVRAYDSEPGKEYTATFQYQLTGLVSRETTR